MKVLPTAALCVLILSLSSCAKPYSTTQTMTPVATEVDDTSSEQQVNELPFEPYLDSSTDADVPFIFGTGAYDTLYIAENSTYRTPQGYYFVDEEPVFGIEGYMVVNNAGEIASYQPSKELLTKIYRDDTGASFVLKQGEELGLQRDQSTGDVMLLLFSVTRSGDETGMPDYASVDSFGLQEVLLYTASTDTLEAKNGFSSLIADHGDDLEITYSLDTVRHKVYKWRGFARYLSHYMGEYIPDGLPLTVYDYESGTKDVVFTKEMFELTEGQDLLLEGEDVIVVLLFSEQYYGQASSITRVALFDKSTGARSLYSTDESTIGIEGGIYKSVSFDDDVITLINMYGEVERLDMKSWSKNTL